MAIEVTKVKDLRSRVSGGKMALLTAYETPGEDQRYFVASSIPAAFDTGAPETLVFAANPSGEITNWKDVAGGKDMSMDEAIDDLRDVLNGKKERDMWTESPGLENGPLDLVMNALNPRIPAGYYDDDE